MILREGSALESPSHQQPFAQRFALQLTNDLAHHQITSQNHQRKGYLRKGYYLCATSITKSSLAYKLQRKKLSHNPSPSEFGAVSPKKFKLDENAEKGFLVKC